jgi:hypothetical protein
VVIVSTTWEADEDSLYQEFKASLGNTIHPVSKQKTNNNEKIYKKPEAQPLGRLRSGGP